MDISALIAQILTPRIKSVQSADGTTYGPAQARISRSPIEFTEDMPAARQGEYFPKTDKIRVNPNSKGFPTAQILRHEQIHAILSKLPMDGAPQTTSAPGFMDIARRIQGNVQGNVEDEVPAYMGQSPNPGFYGISPEQRNTYIQGLQDQLNKLDPGIAARFARLTK